MVSNPYDHDLDGRQPRHSIQRNIDGAAGSTGLSTWLVLDKGTIFRGTYLRIDANCVVNNRWLTDGQ